MLAQPYTPRDVAILVRGDSLYGVGSVNRNYAMLWPEATFVCYGEGPLLDWLDSHGAKVLKLPHLSRFAASSGSLRFVAKVPARWRQARHDAALLAETLKGHGIRLVHTNWLGQQLIAGYLRNKGYKVVWQIHNNMNIRRLGGWGQWFNHQLARWGADLILPVSDYISHNWSGCGVPTVTVRNAAESTLTKVSPVPPRPPYRCLVAGRLEHSKGHHVAVEAVLEARRRGVDVTLDIYGGPLEGNPYADDLQKRITDAGQQNVIQFKGHCSDLRARHTDYHFGLQCRIDPEPCSVWVCETLVDGLPLLASATGGTPELVLDGTTGFLYPPGDATALADRLCDFCQKGDSLSEFRHNAFQRGQQHFLLRHFTENTLRAYNSLLHETK